MTSFTELRASHWPLDQQVEYESLEDLWALKIAYETLYGQITQYKIPDSLVKMWLYMAGPQQGIVSESTRDKLPGYIMLATPPTSADELSNIIPEDLAEFRNLLSKQARPIGVPKEPPMLQENNTLLLSRGETPIGELTQRMKRILENRRQYYRKREISRAGQSKARAKASEKERIKNAEKAGLSLALEEVEFFMLQIHIPAPAIQPTSYYKLIRDKYQVYHHLLASPANAFFPIYGSHNTPILRSDEELDQITDVEAMADPYGNVGDVLRNLQSLFNLFEIANVKTPGLVRLEATITHMGLYAPLVLSILNQQLFSTDTQATVFLIAPPGMKIPPDTTPFLGLRQVIDNTRELLILSNEDTPVIRPGREFEDVLICLGWHYIPVPVTIPRLTSYEKTVAIGKRAVGLANQEEMVLDDVPEEEIDLLNIAEMEFNQRRLPVMVTRHLPNGTVDSFDPNTHRY